MSNTENRNEVIHSAFRLARSLKRRPHGKDHHFAPSVERSLLMIAETDGLSARDLCEALDIRPSSATELIHRLEEAGFVLRRDDEQDKRLTRIYLTETGKAEAALIRSRRQQVAEEFSACFTDEEAAQFCLLANKLSAHLQSREEAGEGGCARPEHRHHGGRPHHRHHRCPGHRMHREC